METYQRMIIDNVFKLVNDGKISEQIQDDILITGNWWILEYPHLLPPTDII